MTHKLDENTRMAVEKTLENPIFVSMRKRKFDKAWSAIQCDPQLAQARSKLSIHELRMIIQHVADAFKNV